jgi:hypothetical protein
VSGPRFPGYDVLDQRENWDEVTRSVVETRLRPRESRSFFSEEEEATCRPLLDRLLGNDEEPRIAVFEQLDRRLALGMTDGFRYDDMPPDADAWRMSLRELEKYAREHTGRSFHDLDADRQEALLAGLQDAESLGRLPMKRLWSVWLRYACAAFYSHPDSWSEIGFGGPAYPRGYKNLGVDRREPWEVADRRPDAGKPARQAPIPLRRQRTAAGEERPADDQDEPMRRAGRGHR